MCGGPGCGKSTCATGLFHFMKIEGYNVELVVEFAKELVYEKQWEMLKDQKHVLAEQARRIQRLVNDVDYVITDSPLFLTLVYNQGSPTISTLAMEEFNRYDNINFLVNRKETFDQIGRMQDLEESIKIDQICENILLTNQLPYVRINGVTDALNFIKGQEND